MRRLAEELHAKWRNLCWTPRRPHGRKLWSKNAGRPRARLGAREEALERPGAPARVWDPSVRWMSRSHGMGNGLFGSKDIRDRSLGGQGKKLGRGRLGTCVGYSMNGRGPGSEGVRGSRPGPARAPGGIRSKRRGGVWRAGVRLRVPGCPRRCSPSPRPYPRPRSRRSERCRCPSPAAAPAAASCCARGRPWPAPRAQRGPARLPPGRRQPMSRGPSWAGGVAPSWSASRLSCAAASSAPSRLSAPPRARPVLAPALQTPLWL